MINTLHLKNFKGFLNSNEINIAPITLLSGQNSSGKSSIIQSLLLLKQTIESPVYDEPLLINGKYVSLGDFSDIYNHFANGVDPLYFEMSFTEEKEIISDEFEHYVYDKLQLDSLKFSLFFNNKKTNNSSQANLLKTSIKGKTDNGGFEVTFEKDDKFNEDLMNKYEIFEKNSFIEATSIYKLSNLKGFDRDEFLGFYANTFLPEIGIVPRNIKSIDFKNEVLFYVIKLLYKEFKIAPKELKINRANLPQCLRTLENKQNKIKEKALLNEEKMENILSKLQIILNKKQFINNHNMFRFYIQRLSYDTYISLLGYLENSLEKNKELTKLKAI